MRLKCASARCVRIRARQPNLAQKAGAGVRTVVYSTPARLCYRGSLGAKNPALIQPFKRPFST